MRNFLKAIKKVSKKVETVSCFITIGCIAIGALSVIVGSTAHLINVWR